MGDQVDFCLKAGGLSSRIIRQEVVLAQAFEFKAPLKVLDRRGLVRRGELLEKMKRVIRKVRVGEECVILEGS